MRQLLTFATFHMCVLVVTIFVAMHAQADEPETKTLTVYSAQKEHLIRPVLDDFTKATGIEIRLTTGKDAALIARLKQEGAQSPADLLLAADVGRLALAQGEALLQPVTSETLSNIIPAHLRSESGYWFGLTQRARILFVRKADIEANPELYENLTYASLADETFAKTVSVRSSENIYNQSLVASMIAHHGEDETAKIVRGIVANFARKPLGGDRDQLRNLAAGVGKIGISNSYYYGLMQTSEDPGDVELAARIAPIFPNQKTTGAHVNIRGGSVTKASKNVAAATQLLEYLVSEPAQRFFADHNYETPVNAKVEANDVVKSWGAFKADQLPLETVGANNLKAVRLMQEAGWK